MLERDINGFIVSFCSSLSSFASVILTKSCLFNFFRDITSLIREFRINRGSWFLYKLLSS